MEKNNNNQTSTENKNSKENKKFKRARARKVIFRLYIGLLMLVTLVFGMYVFNVLYLRPVRTAGSPVFGNRLEDIEPIPNHIVRETETFGASKAHIDRVTISITGRVVYFDVRVVEGTPAATARESTEEIAQYFLDEVGEIAADYSIQLVVSKGDIRQLRDNNRAAVIEHKREHTLFLIEEITAFAERYPTEDNINRMAQNIAAFRRFWDEETISAYEARFNALTPLTEEEQENLREQYGGNLPEADVSREIPRSNIAEFPIWGVLNQRGRFEWR